MTSLSFRPHPLSRIILLIFAVVGLFAWWLVVRADQEMRAALIEQAGLLARAINPNHVGSLTGTGADLDNPDYREIKAQLTAVRSGNPQCRFVYLTGRKPDGTVFFFADSEPPDSKDYSPPGQIYEEVSTMFRRVFDTKTGAAEGPIPDRWGKWVSALVPLTNPRSGNVTAVLGMDVDARDWYWNIAARAAPLVGLLLALGFIIILLHRTNAHIHAHQEELKTSELHLRTILESTADGILAVDNQGSLIKANHRFAELWQIPPPLLATGHNQDLLKFLTDQLSNPAGFLKKIESLNKSKAAEVDILQFKNGRVFESAATPMLLDGTVVGRVWVFRDITERQRVEASHARLATAVEQSAETIVITDTKGAILYANPAFEKHTGYTCAEVLGENPRILKSGEHDAGYYRQMWNVLARGEVWTGHFVNQRKDGTRFEEEATISPVRDTAGKIINYVAVKRDVTHEIQLEAQLRQAQKMEAIGQLAGGVAHDFNNILASLLMQTELTGMVEQLPPEVAEGLAQIRADANRAADLTRQLLLFSRRQVMQPRHLDLNEVVAHLTKMLQRIIGEDVQMQLYLHPAPLMIRADPGMLNQVLMNITLNARDAMPRGGTLRIETSEKILAEHAAVTVPDAAPGRYVCLSVSDTGGGISPEVLPHIFEPFFTTKDAGKGTGLGLATVFGIVKQHQGWLKVDNRPGQGVTFQVFLPTSAATDTEPTPARTTPKPRGGTETILLAEDEAGLRTLTRTILKRHGYQVIEAANGVEAFTLWQQNREAVAMLVTDLVMPGDFNGQELARRLQAEQPGLKVIFISGYSAEIAGQELQLRAGEKFLQKPFAPDRLLEIIRQSLDS